MNPIEAVARALLAARRDGVPADAASFAGALRDADDAFAVQELVLAALDPHPGAVRPYWKAGGPGPGGLASHAPVPRGGVWPSPADAAGQRWHLRLVEAELAVRLGCDVTPAMAASLQPRDLPALVDAVAPAIEVVDSRWRQAMEAPALLKLADLQSHGALVLGPWQPFAPRDWAAQSCEVAIGDRPLAARVGGHALGDPLAVLPGLLRHMARRGATVPCGTVVSTGTWCGVLPGAPGDAVVVRFPGVGAAELRF